MTFDAFELFSVNDCELLFNHGFEAVVKVYLLLLFGNHFDELVTFESLMHSFILDLRHQFLAEAVEEDNS